METRHRLFFAIRPPEDAVPYLVEEQRLFRPGHAVLPQHLHLTTVIVNDYRLFPTAIVAGMLAVGNKVIADQFPIVLDQVVASGRSVAMVPSEPLRGFHAFQQCVATGMARAGLRERDGRRPRAHLTLLYWHGAPLRQPTIPLSWMATEFVLIHSLLGETRHEVLARWPLRAPKQRTLH